MTELPRTEAEMINFLFITGMTRAYGDLSTAAWRSRLTEHDIDAVEKIVIDAMPTGSEFAEEFKLFQTEVAAAKARDLLKQFFAAARAGRLKETR